MSFFAASLFRVNDESIEIKEYQAEHGSPATYQLVETLAEFICRHRSPCDSLRCAQASTGGGG